jgi:transposase-like protein
MLEPGLDKHLWESWWQQFEEDVQTSPAEAMSDLDRLIAQGLETRGYAIDDPVARGGDDRDIVAEYLAAHEVTELLEQGNDVSDEDVADAIEGYRSLHDYLIVERAAP